MGRPRKNYRKVDLENLDETIQQELYAYKDEVRENMISIIKNLSKEAKSKLKSDSPESTGEYKEKWATRLETYPGQPARLTLYNKKYRITHLLEHGHAKKNGGRVQAKPHIQKVQDWISEEFTNRTKDMLKKGR